MNESEIDLLGDAIFALVDEGDLEKIKGFVIKTDQLNYEYDPLQAYEDGRKMSFKETPDFIPFDFYPFQATNEDEITVIEYAKRKGKLEIAKYLEDVVGVLSAKWLNSYSKGYKMVMDARKTITIDINQDGKYLLEGSEIIPSEAAQKAKAKGFNHLHVTAFHEHSLVEAAPLYMEFSRAGISSWHVDYGK